MIYDPKIIGNEGEIKLVWKFVLYDKIHFSYIHEFLIDAYNGSILLDYSLVKNILNRTIYNCDNLGLDNDGIIARTEGSAPTNITDVDLAYDLLQDAYNYYFNKHGRNSIDDNGMELIAHVYYCSSIYGCPMQNAYWNGKQILGLVGNDELYFGEDYVVDDIMGHEYTHGVTDFESDLTYLNQSGASNEAFSDIWGGFIDLTSPLFRLL